MSIAAIVGGQYGSEGKGLIVGRIAKQYGHHVRVGAANAGHTVYAVGPADGLLEKHVMQQVPCAAYANPEAELYIGPGAQISPEIFHAELTAWAEWRTQQNLPPARVNVDPRAHIITDEFVEREQQSDLAKRIGSTSTIAREGIGSAQAARVMREAGCVQAHDYYKGGHPYVRLRNVPWALADADQKGEHVLLEGTQGTGLSLTTGQFPYTTSRNTTAAGLAADCGVAPNRLERVILVCRSYPIRVAGNSGPFWHDSREIAWSDLGVDEENERTTVTKKVRRVAMFSHTQVEEAAMLNGATEIALTFTDYLDGKIFGGAGGWTDEEMGNFPKVAAMVESIESMGYPVRFLGTSPYNVVCRLEAHDMLEAMAA